MVTITTTVSLPDAKVEEARRDLALLNDPHNLLTYNDNYYSASLVRKWGMSPTTLAQLVRAAKRKKTRK